MTPSPIWHPFTQHGLEEPVPLIDHAQGAWLYGADGSRWLDCISSWWVTTHGHCHPHIMAAIAAQTAKLDQLIFAGWTHQPAETLAHRLTGIMPAELTRVFFSDSGSTSVEVALKMALGHWANLGEPRHAVIVMEHSYHGDTIGAMSVGARGVFNQAYAPLLFDVGRIPFPAGPGGSQAAIDALEAACRARPAPAAFIVEPLILGAGGMLVYDAATLAEFARICAAHDVLFIADEVMTGWGRTGTLLACEQAGVAPDILCLSKGLTGGAIPLAVTMCAERIFQSHWSTDRSKTFYHSSSYTANPIACAAANANLDVWAVEPVRDRIAALGKAQAERIAVLADHPRVAATRHLGTIAALDVAGDVHGYLAGIGPRLAAFFRDRQLLLRPMGNTVYVMPPYCTTIAELDMVYAAIAEALDI